MVLKKLLDIFKGSMHVNTMYRDRVSAFVQYSYPAFGYFKQPIPCHLNNNGT